MSDFVSKADCSDQDSTDSVSSDKSSSSDSDEYHFEGHFLPYQDEPRGSSSDESHESDDAPDIDGITRAVLEQRYEKQIPVQQWYIFSFASNYKTVFSAWKSLMVALLL